MQVWNPWHGCKKYSSGCKNCYVYRRDSAFGKDSSIVNRTADFELPLKKTRDKQYKLSKKDGLVYTCMTSDFFIDEADEWRDRIWEIIKIRIDLEFVIITKRTDRISICLPKDWENGYDNVTLVCTCENQCETDKRLPIFLELPAKRKEIICEPFLEKINISHYLKSGKINHVTCGGESGEKARECNYDWVLDLREQCVLADVSFYFKQTGTYFIKGNKRYYIDRKYQMPQAKKAEINYISSSERDFTDIFSRLEKSAFRSHFHLEDNEIKYIDKHGINTIRQHAYDFIRSRLAPAIIPNDGKQTPMRGHPVFIAQHSCACCCRGCLEKWHGIPKGRDLTLQEIDYIAALLMKKIQTDYFGRKK